MDSKIQALMDKYGVQQVEDGEEITFTGFKTDADLEAFSKELEALTDWTMIDAGDECDDSEDDDEVLTESEELDPEMIAEIEALADAYGIEVSMEDGEMSFDDSEAEDVEGFYDELDGILADYDMMGDVEDGEENCEGCKGKQKLKEWEKPNMLAKRPRQSPMQKQEARKKAKKQAEKDAAFKRRRNSVVRRPD